MARHFPHNDPASPCHYCGSETGPRCYSHDAEGRHLACYDCYAKYHDNRHKPNACPACGSASGARGNCALCG